jgi:phage shock protein A
MTMNIQQRKDTMAQQIEEVDRAIAQIDRGTRAPPSFGEEHRAAIDSVVTGLASQLCKRIAALHSVLDRIEQQVLESAQKSKGAMENHVSICVRVDDEIRAMQIVVDDLAKDSGRET